MSEVIEGPLTQLLSTLEDDLFDAPSLLTMNTAAAAAAAAAAVVVIVVVVIVVFVVVVVVVECDKGPSTKTAVVHLGRLSIHY